MPTPVLATITRTNTATDKPARYITWAQKLHLLGRGASHQATWKRIQEFHHLFAFRYTDAIVTRVGEGPRAWTRLPKRLGISHIVRHLLADMISDRQPVWFGARSFDHSNWFAIDVDPDQSREEVLADLSAQARLKEKNRRRTLRNQPPIRQRQPKLRAPYLERCALVETAFRRMGIDPFNPRQVLIQSTPRGGRHYFVFLDTRYNLSQLYDLLNAAGLHHSPGEFEFFPRTNQGMRLPFGYIPGQPHDPNAWIQFIDDYRNHRIHRFSLADLQSHLDQHRDRWARQTQTLRVKQQSTPNDPLTPRPILGIPKAQHSTRTQRPYASRFHNLLNSGIHSTVEAKELLELGIEEEGYRTEVLKHLAAHFIWFCHKSAEEATEFLTKWALNPRHASKDIAADLARGTRVVANHIATMCRWYEEHKRTTPPIGSKAHTTRFAPAEIESLRPYLKNLEPDERHHQVEFLLHFLNFAKRHGIATPDLTAWDAAAAINSVVKKWPGCSHMKYKTRIDHAVAVGVLTKIKEKQQNPKGKGRARTYRLSVPVVPIESETLDYATALATLTTEMGIDGSVEVQIADPANDVIPTVEENNADQPHHPAIPVPKLPAALPQASSDPYLGAGPRQRNQERHAAPGLLGECPRRGRADRTSRRQGFNRQPAPATDCDELVESERQRLTRSRLVASPSPEQVPRSVPPRLR